MEETLRTIHVERASDEDKPVIRDVLARAFNKESWVNWFVLQDERREQRMRRYFGVYLRMPGGMLYTTPDCTGAALWIPPGRWKLNLMQRLSLLPEVVHITGIRALRSRVRAIQKVAERHPRAPHFYLLALGTEPRFQNRGIGSALLRPVLELCDSIAKPAYLETSDEENVPFYERHGFDVLETVHIEGGPTVRLMWRHPAPHRVE